MFYYCNAAAFAASIVVCLLLLVLNSESTNLATSLRVVMLLDLLGLMGAYAAGTCRDTFTVIYSSVIMSAIFLYIVPAFIINGLSKRRENGFSDCEHQNLQNQDEEPEHKRDDQHEVLMVLATFAVTLTYVAGLNPPGGFWGDKEDTRVSFPILKDNYSRRYQAFVVCNSTSFVACLLIIMLLLDRKLVLSYCLTKTRKVNDGYISFFALYGFIIIALFGLVGAFAAGSCREVDTTAYVISLIGASIAFIFLLVGITYAIPDDASGWLKHIKNVFVESEVHGASRDDSNASTSTNSNAYTNTNSNPSLSPSPSPNSDGNDNGNANSNAKTNTNSITDYYPNVNPNPNPNSNAKTNNNNSNTMAIAIPNPNANRKANDIQEALEKARNLIILLATLVASITYQAGLDPPGGLWPDDQAGHKGGDPVLLTTHPTRYKVFFYSNSAAFVASLVVIIMVQSNSLLQRHTLEAAMLLDLFGLIGAYAAGSSRDVSTSIYVVALAGAVLVYVVIHIVFFTLDHEDNITDVPMLDKRREVLLLLAILVATLTYQAGLTPPGGFWLDDSSGHRPGFPVLQDTYAHRYNAFFYCNAMSFMASVALIVLLTNPNLYRPGIRCFALYVCMVAGMFGLMGAYAAGSSRHLQTSIYVLTLVVAVFAFVVLQVVVFFFFRDRIKIDETESVNKPNGCWGSCLGATPNNEQVNPDPDRQSSVPRNKHLNPEEKKDRENKKREKDMTEYLMLLGVLAASVTYQTGLKPPGGLWQENSDGHVAGNSILHDMNRSRYHAFFYCNSTSFMASIVVVVLLLHMMLHKRRLLPGTTVHSAVVLNILPRTLTHNHKLLLWPVHTAVVLNMLGLLGAYAAGSTNYWGTSRNVICLVIPVMVYLAWPLLGKKSCAGRN